MPFKVDLNDLSLEQVPIEEKIAQTQPAQSTAGILIIIIDIN